MGREGADGMQIGNEILIDPRQAPKDRMDTLIHESLHVIFPEFTEKEVEKTARILTRILWQQGYRKVLL